MCYIGKGAPVDERRIIFKRLHQVWHEGISQENRHGAISIQLLRCDGITFAIVADDNFPKPVLQILQIRGQAKDCHHLRGDGNVKSILAGKSIRDSPGGHNNIPERPIIHINNPSPTNPPHVDIQLVSVVNMIVD